jgi:hypothetical protein
MKKNTISFLQYIRIIVCLFVFVFFLAQANAQKIEPETVFKYVKNTDQSRTLTYIVKYVKADAKKSSAIADIPITFSTGVANEKLATIKTDGYGEAHFIIPASQKLPVKNGKFSFAASIEENAILESKKDSITLVDLLIEMNLEVKDSIKTIAFKTSEIDPNGLKKPVKTDVIFYVSRTFSKLKVIEGSTADDGTGEVEFPNDIPGDSIGNINIICRVEENEFYSNVENEQRVAWGVRTNYHIAKFHRALWTTIAPTWMIVTLTILLLGVWGHYMFVLYKIFRIRKESSKSEYI